MSHKGEKRTHNGRDSPSVKLLVKSRPIWSLMARAYGRAAELVIIPVALCRLLVEREGELIFAFLPSLLLREKCCLLVRGSRDSTSRSVRRARERRLSVRVSPFLEFSLSLSLFASSLVTNGARDGKGDTRTGNKIREKGERSVRVLWNDSLTVKRGIPEIRGREGASGRSTGIFQFLVRLISRPLTHRGKEASL